MRLVEELACVFAGVEGVQGIDDAAPRGVAVFGELELFSLEAVEEGEGCLGGVDGDDVCHCVHGRARDVGGVEVGEGTAVGPWEVAEGVGPEGEGGARSFVVADEGVGVLCAGDVYEGHGGFEDDRGGDVGVGALKIEEGRRVKAVVYAVRGGLDCLAWDVGRRVESLAVKVDVCKALDVPVYLDGSTRRISQ